MISHYINRPNKDQPKKNKNQQTNERSICSFQCLHGLVVFLIRENKLNSFGDDCKICSLLVLIVSQLCIMLFSIFFSLFPKRENNQRQKKTVSNNDRSTIPFLFLFAFHDESFI